MTSAFISLSADLQIKQRVAVNTEAGWFLGTVKITKIKYVTVKFDDGDTAEVSKTIDRSEVRVLPESTPKSKKSYTTAQLKALMDSLKVSDEPVAAPIVKPKPRQIGVTAPPTSSTQHAVKEEPDVSHVTDAVEALGIVYEAQIRNSTNAAIERRFMLDLWTALNKKSFNGQLRPVKKLMVIPSKRQGLRAFWHPRYRIIVFGDLVFKANWAKFHEVFLHEMCHQAVTDVDHSGVAKALPEGGHGPEWQAWMRKVGLEPKRYDDSTFSEYMTDDEKELFDRHAESAMSEQALSVIRKQNHYEEIAKQKLPRVKNGVVGALVVCSDGTTEEPFEAVITHVRKDSLGTTEYTCKVFISEFLGKTLIVAEDDDTMPLHFMKEPRLKYRATARRLAEEARKAARKEGRVR